MYSIVEVGSFSYPKPTKEVNEDFLLLPTYDLESNIIFAIVIFLKPQILKTISGLSNTLPAIFDCLSRAITNTSHTVRTILSPYRLFIF